MTAETALVALPTNTNAIERYGMTRDQLDLLKRTIAKGTTDDEFALFMNTAKRLGLDPFAKQIFCVKRWDSKEKREVMAIQVSIDGFRSTAIRTDMVDGQEGPFWCGEDGVWTDVWLHQKPPAGAKVLVYRKGVARPFTGVAAYRSYVQTKSDGAVNSMWSRGPDFMLAKCAEALALRKAFPAELGDVHAPEEMGNDEPVLMGLPAPAGTQFAPATAPCLPAGVHGSGAPPARPPSKAAAEPMKDLTEPEVIEIIAEFAKHTTIRSLREYGAARLANVPDGATRDRLAAAYDDQRELIIHAAETEK